MGRLRNESGVHSIGRRIDIGVARTVRVDRNVGGWGNLVKGVRFGTKGDGVVGYCFRGGPFHRLANMDHFGLIHETHDRGGFRASAGAVDLACPSDDGVVIRCNLGRISGVGDQPGALLVCLLVIKRLVVRQERGRIQHMDSACLIIMRKTHRLKISRLREDNRIGGAVRQDPAVYARTPIDD